MTGAVPCVACSLPLAYKSRVNVETLLREQNIKQMHLEWRPSGLQFLLRGEKGDC